MVWWTWCTSPVCLEIAFSQPSLSLWSSQAKLIFLSCVSTMIPYLRPMDSTDPSVATDEDVSVTKPWCSGPPFHDSFPSVSSVTVRGSHCGRG
jgi:hypothetical protein